MSKLHIKKGDTVYVNAGNDKGKTGRVLRVLVSKNRAVVEASEYGIEERQAECQAPAGRHHQNGSPDPRFKFESFGS